MLRKATFLIIALAFAFAAGTASAQTECVVGVYADEAGSSTTITPQRDLGTPLTTFSVYYVIFVEDFVNAVAWDREISGIDVVATTVSIDGYGNFLDERPEGWRIGLGGCQIGFGGIPIPLMREDITFVDDYQGGTGSIQVLPNVIEDPTTPIYSDCQAILHPCGTGSLVIETVVANESESWGSVKALYN